MKLLEIMGQKEYILCMGGLEIKNGWRMDCCKLKMAIKSLVLLLLRIGICFPSLWFLSMTALPTENGRSNTGPVMGIILKRKWQLPAVSWDLSYHGRSLLCKMAVEIHWDNMGESPDGPALPFVPINALGEWVKASCILQTNPPAS